MTSVLRVSLIVSTYNAADYLARVLRAVAHQTCLPDEILLADDGSGEDTQKLFADWAAAQTLGAQHVWQPHEGFRKAGILNRAIARARADYVVFLDGDMIPHPQFLADHKQLARDRSFVQGHRVLIGERAAQWFGRNSFPRDRRRACWQGQLSGWKNAFRWPRPLVRQRADLRGVRGCNLGLWREDLVRVNGYNEAFVGWGREDSDLAVRLMNAGVTRLDARGWGLCYHLWHPPVSRTELPTNDELLADAIEQRATRCASGLDQHLGKDDAHSPA
jgi:glycosyltransferase involved in cell wall biosynthesis